MADRNGAEQRGLNLGEPLGNRGEEIFSSFNHAFLQIFEQNRSIVQHMMQAMQEESLRLMSARYEHTSQAIERSRECRGLSAMFMLQQDWLAEMAHDYAEFNKRFGELLQESAEHGAEHAQQLTEETTRKAKSAARERAAA